jgi:hypothetical protein
LEQHSFDSESAQQQVFLPPVDEKAMQDLFSEILCIPAAATATSGAQASTVTEEVTALQGEETCGTLMVSDANVNSTQWLSSAVNVF